MSGSGARRSSLRRRLLVLFLAAAAVGLLAAVLVGPRVVRELRRATRDIPLSRVALCRCLPDTDLRLVRPDGIELAASLYGSEHLGEAPAIVIAHGNTPDGRRLPLYRVLATKLAEAGHPVLTFDHAGFGQSDDPFRLGTVEALSMEHDLRAAVDHLEARGAGGSVVLIGHSGGAVAIFDLALADPRIAGLVAMGPPRRTLERLEDPEDAEYFWSRARESHRSVYGEDFPAWYDREVWIEHMRSLDLESRLERFALPGHPPLLLMDGERESRADRDYLARFAARVAPPVRYVTIAESSHYANTRELRRAGLAVYDRRVVGETLRAITDWMAEHRIGVVSASGEAFH